MSLEPDAEDTELFSRPGLPASLLYLEAQCPRLQWPELALDATALHWLEIHGWFRGMLRSLVELGSDLRGGGLAAPAFHRTVMPGLVRFLQNLEGHHEIESGSYFPALAAAEPRMRPGFELLDRDHDQIHGLLEAMAAAGRGLHSALTVGQDGGAAAQTLADAIERAARPIERHLHDEEDIVVPVLTLRGDPYSHLR